MRLNITRLDERACGVALDGDQRVTVPYVLPGDIVQIEGEGATAHPVICQPQMPQATPICRYFGRCGGCVAQHVPLELYKSWKRGRVEEQLLIHEISYPVEPLLDAHGVGRRRVAIHVRQEEGAIIAGFMAAGSQDLIDIDRCPILAPALDQAMDLARAIGIHAGTCDVLVSTSESGLDCAVKAERSNRLLLERHLPEVARRFQLVRLTLNGAIVIENEAPDLTMGRARVRLPPAAFLQATQGGEEALTAFACEALAKARTVADLFCGVGPFALRLAETATVDAFDSDKVALDAMTQAVHQTSGLKPVHVFRRDLMRSPLIRGELDVYDGIVIDPPRAGAQDQMREIAGSKLKTIVSISCNAKTFARDLAILTNGGFVVERIVPIDQFRYSGHVEIAAHLRRNKKLR